MLSHAELCFTMLCHAQLCCVTLWHAVLLHAVQMCFMLCHAVHPCNATGWAVLWSSVMGCVGYNAVVCCICYVHHFPDTRHLPCF